MTKMLKTAVLAAVLTLAAGAAEVRAQHTLAVTGGYGMTTSRLYPKQETKAIWGACSGGLSWRYYSLPRFVGGFGIDLEWMQRGYSYAPYASLYEDQEGLQVLHPPAQHHHDAYRVAAALLPVQEPFEGLSRSGGNVLLQLLVEIRQRGDPARRANTISAPCATTASATDLRAAAASTF